MSNTNTAALQEAVKAMGHTFFDVTIICCTDNHQAAHWMNVLEHGLLEGRKVLAVSEDDWNGGGAGNGLGTLYAWQKAVALAQTKYPGFDLAKEAANVSCGLYHTAGKGTRMAPLPASENNNKPGVKLPFCVKGVGDTYSSITVLESVIRQTGIYAANRTGRLSVFWGDQVFLPTAAVQAPTHHADILCTLLGDTAPSATEWTDQGLDKYGVIAVVGTTNDETTNKPLEAAQVEKVSHAVATQMLGSLGEIRQVGPSLGSFSVSAIFLEALMEEYQPELSAKVAKLDTDPHFWMPLTLPLDSYVSLMKGKGTDETESKSHYARMAAMKTKFLAATKDDSMGLFGAVNVGKGACWWDYGQLGLYSANCLLLLERTPDADLLRSFLGLDNTSRQFDSTVGTDAVTDDDSYLFGSKIGTGSVTKSLLANVAAQTIDAKGAILVNCASSKGITAGEGSIVYNVVDTAGAGITVGPGEVVVGVTDESGASFLLKSRMDIDGGKAWKLKLDMNDVSFEEVRNKNMNANIGEISQQRQQQFETVKSSF